MSKFNLLYSSIQEFTPKGQMMAINFLKKNRQVLGQNYGFTKIPQMLIESGKLDSFEKELWDENYSIQNIINDNLRKTLPKLKYELQKIYNRQFEFNRSEQESSNFTKYLQENFSEKKFKLAKLFAQEEYSEKFALPILNFDITPEEVSKIIFAYNAISNKAYSQEIRKTLRSCDPQKLERSIPLELEQDIHKISCKIGKRYLTLYKILEPKSKDLRVKLIENIIKTKYNLDFVYLDNYDDAKNIYKSLSLIHKRNITLPKNIIVCPSELEVGGVNVLNPDGTSSIIITPSYLLEKNKQDALNNLKYTKARRFMNIALRFNDFNKYSTQYELHTPLHELLHTERIFPKYTIASLLPRRFNSTIDNLSLYAKNTKRCNVEEIRVELLAKKILLGLNKKEEELLDYIFKTYTVPQEA